MTTSVVCISRTLAAGGEEVGHLVARSLGFQYADEEILDHAAARAGVTSDAMAKAERPPGLVSRIVESLVVAAATPQAGAWSGMPPLTAEPLPVAYEDSDPGRHSRACATGQGRHRRPRRQRLPSRHPRRPPRPRHRPARGPRHPPGRITRHRPQRREEGRRRVRQAAQAVPRPLLQGPRTAHRLRPRRQHRRHRRRPQRRTGSPRRPALAASGLGWKNRRRARSVEHRRPRLCRSPPNETLRTRHYSLA